MIRSAASTRGVSGVNTSSFHLPNGRHRALPYMDGSGAARPDAEATAAQPAARMSSGAEGVLTVAESLERAGLPQYAPKLAELEFLSEYQIYRAGAATATRLALLDYLHPFPGRAHAHEVPTQLPLSLPIRSDSRL